MAAMNASDKISSVPSLEKFKQSRTAPPMYGPAGSDFLRFREFPMLQGTTYLDHAGTTLYPRSLMDAFSKDMMSDLLGNPHSASASSRRSTARIEDTRLRVLQFFNAHPDEYDLVFVSNATAGIKLVMESFRDLEEGFWYGYHKDAHTSLVGARELARNGHYCFTSDEEVEKWLDADNGAPSPEQMGVPGIFAYPAQSNMDGRRLPLSWTKRLKSSRQGLRTYSLLDAAALVSTSPLDLGETSIMPDFTVVSFNKIFGFPDLGALIVRKESEQMLRKRKYFGGGTVDMVTCGKENWYIPKDGKLHEQLEDGTLPIHSIIALDNAMTIYKELFGSIQHVATHTGSLAQNLYNDLSTLRHANGLDICTLYKNSSSSYANGETQGPIIALNLRNSLGEWISNSEVEKLASIRNIHIRSGGLCNPGGTASSLGLQPWEMRRNFSAGHRCGNENDIIGGKPTGALRVSLGAMSSMQDVTSFVEFLREFFVEGELIPQATRPTDSDDTNLFVETLTVYPIKSCGGWSVPPDTLWEIRDEGLAWDREWCLVHQGTRTALSQKRHPKMALLRPNLELDNCVLRVRHHGAVPPSTPAEIIVPLSADPNVFQIPNDELGLPSTQICGDSIAAQTYASQDIATFFTNIVGTPCTLARFPPATVETSARHSKFHLHNRNKLENSKMRPQMNHAPILLSNESPILTITRSSLNRLNEQIKHKGGKAAHASVFRANIIISQDPALAPGSERPYAEDEWRSLHVGQNLKLSVLGSCRRCQMICVDQRSAEKNEEPFVTLAKTRRKEGKVFFGVHTSLVNSKEKHVAKIQVGDKVIPL